MEVALKNRDNLSGKRKRRINSMGRVPHLYCGCYGFDACIRLHSASSSAENHREAASLPGRG